jgi:hypothetical protein
MLGIARPLTTLLAASGLVLGAFSTPVDAQNLSRPRLFLTSSSFANPANNFFLPTGIATAGDGNVFVFDLNVAATALRAYAPRRQLLGAVPTGDITDLSGQGYLERDPASGLLYLLREDGGLFEVDPRTLAVHAILNLRQAGVVIGRPWDVATERFVNGAAGLIVPTNMTFGDFAIRSTARRTDFLISGLSVGHAFVMRLRIAQGRPPRARVLLFSSTSTAGTTNLTRGVAVNRSGVAVTSLPVVRSSAGPIDVLVTFRNDMSVRPRTLFAGGGQPLVNAPSRAADVDPLGNFYVLTNVVGSTLCGVAGSGALLVLRANLRRVRCHPVSGQPLNNTTDVAYDPTTNRVYFAVIVNGGGAILFFRRTR